MGRESAEIIMSEIVAHMLDSVIDPGDHGGVVESSVDVPNYGRVRAQKMAGRCVELQLLENGRVELVPV